MKKIISLIMIFAFALHGFAVFAEEEELFATFEEVKFAETYIDQAVSFFGLRKTVEETLIEGWSNLSQEISLKDYEISFDDIGDIYRGILYSNPEIYYVTSGFNCGYNSETNIVTYVIPSYTETDTTVIAETLDAIDDATEEIMLYLDEDMTDFEKVMTVHDYMVLHYDYDYTYTNHDITIMLTKTGVCMSYALAFKHIMNQLDIECLYVSAQKSMDHAWNLVKIDDEWYHIDLTWDDPGINYGQVSHKYALLSDFEIQHLLKPHFGYDLKGLEADSDMYDDAHWHDGVGAVVTIGDNYYYVDGNNIVDQNGEIIYTGLDVGDNGWSIGEGYVIPDGNFSGIAEHNGILYFNTDGAVYSYNPASKNVVKILDYDGVCGLFIDKNTLEYCKFDMVEEKFIKAGEYRLGKIRFGGTFHKNNKLIKRIYRERDADNVYVYSACRDCIQMEEVTESTVTKVSFDSKDCQTLYYWDEEMRPLKEKEIYYN